MGRSASGKHPNILFISVDQWPGSLMGVAGHPTVETPTLDRLAAVGTRFTRAYSECPICIPARRSMMTGTSPRKHGDREFQTALPMPADFPTLARTFGDAGYQTYAIGKLHVYPQRDRIGFDDALIAEEGRSHLGAVDDYEIFLADQGHPGEQFLHGMSNNEYGWRTWHLPEELHVTNWTTMTAARTIKRRDPTRPALWHVSYTHPHPPIVPLASYFERYRNREIALPPMADWARDPARLPFAARAVRAFWPYLKPAEQADMLRAFYAQCTHIDHQLRLIIGTLREEDVLDDTIILVTGDHGDMLGTSGFYAKRLMYEGSVGIPMILVGTAKDRHLVGRTDDRLVGLQDVMPTLLELSGIPVPASCEGRSMVTGARREALYCESLIGRKATRMIHNGRHKLIWYPAGNVVQLFDVNADPTELRDLSNEPSATAVLEDLTKRLIAELYGTDLGYAHDGRLIGLPDSPDEATPNRGLSGQRGVHFPPLAPTDPTKVVGAG